MTNTTTESGPDQGRDGGDETRPALAGANRILGLPLMAQRELEARFWAKTEADPATDCLIWTGAVGQDGYGTFKGCGKTFRAHRVARVLACGAIPAGLMVRHTCHTPLCVNTAHLETGTHAENMRDKVEARRQARGPGSNPRKVTAEDAVAIVGARLLGATVKESARDFGVDRWTIKAVLAGRTRAAAVEAHLDAVLPPLS